MRLKLVCFILLAVFCWGCRAPKNVTYFQGIDKVTPEALERMYQEYAIRICPDDLLAIWVTAWDQSVTTPFNPSMPAFLTQAQAQMQSTNPSARYAATPDVFNYLVNAEGNIQYPVIGNIHVQGLTEQELSDKLQKEIAEYIEKPLVYVKIMNFKVNVLGDVVRPGTILFKNERVSILDAIAAVGDLTISGNRENVLIIRENDGKREFASLDLTNPALFSSPYFYLKQNDVVYVEPNAAKQKNSRYSQEEQFTVSLFSPIISAVNIVVTVLLTTLR